MQFNIPFRALHRYLICSCQTVDIISPLFFFKKTRSTLAGTLDETQYSIPFRSSSAFETLPLTFPTQYRQLVATQKSLDTVFCMFLQARDIYFYPAGAPLLEFLEDTYVLQRIETKVYIRLASPSIRCKYSFLDVINEIVDSDDRSSLSEKNKSRSL